MANKLRRLVLSFGIILTSKSKMAHACNLEKHKDQYIWGHMSRKWNLADIVPKLLHGKPPEMVIFLFGGHLNINIQDGSCPQIMKIHKKQYLWYLCKYITIMIYGKPFGRRELILTCIRTVAYQIQEPRFEVKIIVQVSASALTSQCLLGGYHTCRFLPLVQVNGTMKRPLKCMFTFGQLLK